MQRACRRQDDDNTWCGFTNATIRLADANHDGVAHIPPPPTVFATWRRCFAPTPADLSLAPSFVSPRLPEADRARSPSSLSAASSSTNSSPDDGEFRADDNDSGNDTYAPPTAESMVEARLSQQAAEPALDHEAPEARRHQYMAPMIRSGSFMRGFAAEARAWSARALAVAGNRDDIDPVSMLLPEAALGQRIGGQSGRGPLLRRLQTRVHGELFRSKSGRILRVLVGVVREAIVT